MQIFTAHYAFKMRRAEPQMRKWGRNDESIVNKNFIKIPMQYCIIDLSKQ